MRSGSGPRRRLALACTTAAALAFAGCGSAAEQERERSERERARAALLTQTDVGAEWTRTDSGTDSAMPSREQLERICPGYPAEWLVGNEDELVAFESDSGAISHGITTVADGGEAGAQFDDFGSARSRRCMRGIMEWSMQEADAGSDVELAVGDVRVATLERDGGERGMRVTMTIGTPDGSVSMPVEGDIVTTHAGDTFSTVFMMAIQQPLDATLRDRLTEIAGERLRQNFG